MTSRTNTLAVQVVAYGKANKELDDVSRAFKQMKAESQVLGNDLPIASRKASDGLMGFSSSSRKAELAMNSMIAVAAGAAAAIGSAAVAVFTLAKQSAEAGDKAFEASQRLGVSTEFITQMGFAARQS